MQLNGFAIFGKKLNGFLQTHFSMTHLKRVLIMSLLTSLITACASNPLPSIATVPNVNLKQFMGDWYVIAAIPTAIETEAYNAIESYKLNEDGTIATTFTFNKGSLDGKVKTYEPKGFVIENSGNALWGMQFIWPIKAEYRITYLDANYSQTIIARNARDYVWIMARDPNMSDADYAKLTKIVADYGYDVAKLRRVPHKK